MNSMHFHLIANHIPIIGFLCATAIMFVALILSKRESFMVGAFVAVASCTMLVFTYISGEGAEEHLEALAIADTSEAAVEEHEDAAAIALLFGIIGGVAAGTSLMLFQRQPLRQLHQTGWIVVGLNLAALAAAGYTGYWGGQIRHSELRPQADLVPAQPILPPLSGESIEPDLGSDADSALPEATD